MPVWPQQICNDSKTQSDSEKLRRTIRRTRYNH